MQDIPAEGQWPTDPQQDQPISDDRYDLWLAPADGRGHAGAMLQARKLGKELWVGVHSDEDILAHKGPSVMTLAERVAAIDACRWSTKAVPYAPYVTSLPWVSHYGCQFVVHGDDTTLDENGEDCYRFVKAVGRFRIVKRTPGISTTDLVGRMLLYTKDHFIPSQGAITTRQESAGSSEHETKVHTMMQRIRDYATDETGLHPGCEVYQYDENATSKFSVLVNGTGPEAGQKIVYVDGGFDLFSSGHIEFLKQVQSASGGAKAYIVAGIHEDHVVNARKGLNYPIMNIFERGLCLLQCRYINAVIFAAPYSPTETYLRQLPQGMPNAVYHGPTSCEVQGQDPYMDAKRLGLYREIESHRFGHVNAQEIVARILSSRDMYEARQRAKAAKG